MEKVLIAGAGGFIGGHLAKKLLQEGFEVKCADIKPLNTWFQLHKQAENHSLDLRLPENCINVSDVDLVFNMAANMGGMGFIESHGVECMMSSTINTNLLNAASDLNVFRYFYSSSACVYNIAKQSSHDVIALKEEDAYPAQPEGPYGWEKLFSEILCQAFSKEKGLETRIARFHNVYGPHGSWNDGREKAPAAICRKVAESKLQGKKEIEIWGDGEQLRTFTYIEDCIEGIMRLMFSDEKDPLNIGSSEIVSINQLTDMISEIAGVKLDKKHILDSPLGVVGRSSDNTKIKQALEWEPTVPMTVGLQYTYKWIHDQISK